jgi:hypothetical protein
MVPSPAHVNAPTTDVVASPSSSPKAQKARLCTRCKKRFRHSAQARLCRRCANTRRKPTPAEQRRWKAAASKRKRAAIAEEFGEAAARVVQRAKVIDVEIGQLRREREELCVAHDLCRVCLRRETECGRRTCGLCGRAVRNTGAIIAEAWNR